MNANVATAIILIHALFLFVLLTGPVARLVRDDLRSRLREIRDNLFDFMWQKGHDYDSPAYRATRDMLNDMIHGVRLLSLPLVFAAYASRKSEPKDQLSEALAQLPEGELKAQICKSIAAAHREIMSYIFFKTPLGLIFCGLALVFLVALTAWMIVCHGRDGVERFIGRLASHVVSAARRVGRTDVGHALVAK